ncbi:aminoacetone oxidase family FAD-binding enzyme [Anaerosinus sp.]
MKKVIVIGGGAAGLIAAIYAARSGANVTVLEKMKRVGKKLLITGKGRCNITNTASKQEYIKNMIGNGSFLYSAFSQYSNEDVVDFFHQLDVPTKVERGGRVFPVSDKAADVVNALVHEANRLGVEIITDQAVSKIQSTDGKITGVKSISGGIYPADAVILATGGASYPGTGSTGDGYTLVKELGHSIIKIHPSLVPLETEDEWVKDAQGLSLKNIRATILVNGIKAGEDFGEMLFTHYGVSGPIILSLSRLVAENLNKDNFIELVINLKPALTEEVLNKRIQRDFDKFIRKQIKNSLGELLPAKLIPVIMDLAYLDPEKPINQVTKEERQRLIETIMGLTLTIKGTRPVSEAIVTAGGINIKEINPRTMESKIIQGLYFAGEVIDIDGLTGGYNLQAAFSTGYVAGFYAAD